VRRPNCIELPDGTAIPILYEDRSVLAIDKPPFWMLIPYSWQRTDRNLQAALVSSIAANHFWARSRGIKFLRYLHRLDAETTGILLFGKSHGALETYGRLFESRQMQKTYLVVVRGVPRQTEWTCRLKLASDRAHVGRMKVDARHGKDAETDFCVIETRTENGGPARTLLEAHPLTGRTHQIRVHCAQSGHPVLGDELYGAGKTAMARAYPLALRAVALSYTDPFTRRRVCIEAPRAAFLSAYGFAQAGALEAVWTLDHATALHRTETYPKRLTITWAISR
jgi:RluA family pseudouridine synthase